MWVQPITPKDIREKRTQLRRLRRDLGREVWLVRQLLGEIENGIKARRYKTWSAEHVNPELKAAIEKYFDRLDALKSEAKSLIEAAYPAGE